MSDKWKQAIAALAILLGFGLVAHFMPSIMLWIGESSPLAAGGFAVLFVMAFFGIFWLRSKVQARRDSDPGD